jgi:hypothetical protein
MDLESRAPFERRVAQELRAALQRMTPWHVRVQVTPLAEGIATRVWSILWLRSSEAEQHGGSVAERATNVLHVVQDFMANQTRRAWPAAEKLDDRSPAAIGNHLPQPAAVVEEGWLVVSYRCEAGDTVVLRTALERSVRH